MSVGSKEYSGISSQNEQSLHKRSIWFLTDINQSDSVIFAKRIYRRCSGENKADLRDFKDFKNFKRYKDSNAFKQTDLNVSLELKRFEAMV